MPPANKLSRCAVANGGFGDPDLTPKPLRISKRDHARTSTTGTISSLFPIPKSQTQGNLQALAPSNESSSWIDNTPLDLSIQCLAAPTSQWARRNSFLHVHKQRQSEPINTNPASLTKTCKEPNEPIGLSSVASPAGSRRSCPTMSQLGNTSDTGTAVSATRPVSIRAFTIGTYGKHNPLSPVHEVSSSNSASPALRTRQRRAVTNAEACYKDRNSYETSPHRITQRSSSTKNNLISRVMSGLTNRNYNSHAASRGGYDGVQTPSEHPPSTLSRSREIKHVLKQSDSSIETDTSSERNPQHARGAYPTPPTSRTTSSTTAGSVDSHHSIMPQRFRDLCQPADAVVMGAELTLTPEYDELRTRKEQSLWVSLDIKGTANSPPTVQDVWSEHTRLDIVVVIDNSLHTSPAALMASCETARFLVSILNRVTDRFAILCTSVTHTGGDESKLARKLVRLNDVLLDKVKTYLDVITSSKEMMKADDWADAIDCAKDVLLKCTVTDPEEDLLQDTFGHIFILTPDADGLPSQSLAHDDLTFHIICPASIPRNDQARIHCNGWKMRSLSGNDTQVVSKRKDVDPMSVTNRLRALIAQARSGKRLGNLTELFLEVSAGPDCILEGVMGNVNFPELHLGEVYTVLFRLTVRGATVQDDLSSGNSASSSPTLPNANDVLGQLDTLFGTTKTKALTARLTYKHSLLPAGTTCSVTTDCHIKRRPPDPDQEPTLSHSKYLLASDCTVLVDKRLAYHQATQDSPRNALKTLRSEFGETFQYSACQEYVHLLAMELKHQARILERLELKASPPKTRKIPTSPPPTPTASFWRRPATHNHGDENRQPGLHRKTSDMSTEERKKTPTSPRTANYSFWRPTAHVDGDGNSQPDLRRKRSDMSVEELFGTEPALAATTMTTNLLAVKESREKLRTDEARRIWGDLRRMRKGGGVDGADERKTDGKGGLRSLSGGSLRAEEAKKVALKNKRSLGSETLRSIFSVGEGAVGKGVGAPWL